MSQRNGLLEALDGEMPLSFASFAPTDGTGLILVDLVNGFCTVGAGNLAPRTPDQRITSMVEQCCALAKRWQEARRPILAFQDTHEAQRPELPYPPHCVRGSGEEEFVPELAWLAHDPDALCIRKDCINGFVGAMEQTFTKGVHGASHNRCVDWINGHRLQSIVVAGICTDICVMDFVVTIVSARNHGLMPTLEQVVVFEPGCATYDLPRAVTQQAELPETAAHPQAIAHHMGLYFMAARGAVLARELVGL